MMMARKLGLLALATVALAGCSKGTHYPVTPAQAHQMLVKRDLPLMMFGAEATGTRLVAASNSQVVWAVTDANDTEMLRLAANIAPEADGSRISTEVLPPAGRRHDKVEQGLAENEAIADLYRAVGEEQVASTMADRKFRYDAINSAMIKAAFATLPKLQQQAMEQASEAQRARREAETNARSGYASGDDWNARRRERAGEPDPTFGKPMDDHGSSTSDDEDY